MGAPLSITLDGTEYKIPTFTIGQHERMVDAKAFEVLAIALERAAPKVDDPRAIEATFPELKTAIAAVMAHNGYKAPDPNG